MITKDTPITEAEKEAFRSFQHSSIKARLDAYIEYRSELALSEASIEAEKGNALKAVAKLQVHTALTTFFDDFSSQFS